MHRFKNLYRGQFFNFWSAFFFFPQNFTPRDAHCFWQCTNSRTFTEGNFSTSGPLLSSFFSFTEGNFSTSGPLFSSFFFLKISLLEMLIAFGNEHLKNTFNSLR